MGTAPSHQTSPDVGVCVGACCDALIWHTMRNADAAGADAVWLSDVLDSAAPLRILHHRQGLSTHERCSSRVARRLVRRCRRSARRLRTHLYRWEAAVWNVVCVGEANRHPSAPLSNDTPFSFGTHPARESDCSHACLHATQIFADLAFGPAVALKSWEHLWPMIAHFIDVRFNWKHLRRVYGGAPRWLTTMWAMGSYFAFGSLWEHTVKTGEGASNTLIVYLQPQKWSTSALCAQVGITPPAGMAEDAIFATVQKLIMTGVATMLLWRIFVPLTLPPSVKSEKKIK